MKKVNLNVAPKNGYRFTDVDGTLIIGKSWGAVIDRVRAYRRRNKLATGNAEKEVRAQICQNNPEVCSGETSEQREVSIVQVASIKSRVLLWFSQMRKKRDSEGIHFVGQVERDRRIAICVHCPMQSAYPSGCASCKKAITEFRKDLTEHRHIDSRLVGCSALGEDTGASVWIDEPRVEGDGLPANCWRRRGV